MGKLTHFKPKRKDCRGSPFLLRALISDTAYPLPIYTSKLQILT